MSLDMNNVISDMLSAASEAIDEGIGDFNTYAGRILENHRNSLAELAEARIAGHIDNTVFERELERERVVLETELITLQIISRAAAQRAINSAIDAFARSVRALM